LCHLLFVARRLLLQSEAPWLTCLKVLHLREISSSRCAEDLHAARMLPGLVSEVGLSPNKNVIMHADFEPRCIQCPTA